MSVSRSFLSSRPLRTTAQGSLSALQYARAAQCPWDEWTMGSAANAGHLAILQWCRANNCPWGPCTCAEAAAAGNLQVRVSETEGLFLRRSERFYLSVRRRCCFLISRGVLSHFKSLSSLLPGVFLLTFLRFRDTASVVVGEQQMDVGVLHVR